MADTVMAAMAAHAGARRHQAWPSQALATTTAPQRCTTRRGSAWKKGHGLSNARRRRTPKAWRTGGSMASEQRRQRQIDVDHQVRRREAVQIRTTSSPATA
jgi:hypothetical protein